MAPRPLRQALAVVLDGLGVAIALWLALVLRFRELPIEIGDFLSILFTAVVASGAVLKSKDFARAFITDLNLMPVLLESAESGDQKPDNLDAVRVFDGIRVVAEDKKSGLVTPSIRWKDPDIAAEWANLLVKRLNDRLRTQAEAESQRNVDYLQREIAATSVVSLQQSMGRVLEGEMQKLMLARGNEEFAFKVIDRATPPKQRDAPKRTLIALVSLFAGGVFGILAVFVRKAIANRPKRSS